MDKDLAETKGFELALVFRSFQVGSASPPRSRWPSVHGFAMPQGATELGMTESWELGMNLSLKGDHEGGFLEIHSNSLPCLSAGPGILTKTDPPRVACAAVGELGEVLRSESGLHAAVAYFGLGTVCGLTMALSLTFFWGVPPKSSGSTPKVVSG